MISSICYSNRKPKLLRLPFRGLMAFVLLLMLGCGHGKEALEVGTRGVADRFLIAVLPVDNLSGAGGTQAHDLRKILSEMLVKEGYTLLSDGELEGFMTRHRIRYVGGIDSSISRAFLEEKGVNAVLVTSLELFYDTDPPKISVTCRLVSTGEKTEILWIDGVGMSGDDHPGLLDLGMVHDPALLREKALRHLVNSMTEHLNGAGQYANATDSSIFFGPKTSFDAMYLREGKKYTIGVLPFINLSERKYAGEMTSLIFVKELAKMAEFKVMEPGIIRERLLNSRIIMSEGISKFELDVLSNSMGTDLMVSGKVNRFLDLNIPGGVPKVEFSILMMEGWDKRIIWSSISYNEGNDAVFFYDVGRISTAKETATKMVRTLLDGIDWSGEGEGEFKEKHEEFDLFKLFKGKK